MRLVAIRYTDNTEAFERFYTALGLTTSLRSRTDGWIELDAPISASAGSAGTGSAGTVALHRSGGEPRGAEISFESDEPLEAVRERLVAAGFPAGALIDESYGRSLQLTDPDGTELWINETDPSLIA